MRKLATLVTLILLLLPLAAVAQPVDRWPPSWTDSFNDQPFGHPIEPGKPGLNWEVPGSLLSLNPVYPIRKDCAFPGLCPFDKDGALYFRAPSVLVSRYSPVPNEGSYSVAALVTLLGLPTPRPGDHFGLFTRVHYTEGPAIFTRFGVAIGTGAAGCVGDAFIQLTGESNSFFKCFNLSHPIDWVDVTKSYWMVFDDTVSASNFHHIFNATIYEVLQDGTAILLGGESVDFENDVPKAMNIELPLQWDSKVAFGAVFGDEMRVVLDQVIIVK